MSSNDSHVDVDGAPTRIAPPPLQDKEFLPSLALMRGMAALMVVYDHLVGVWPAATAVVWRPAVLADHWIFEPLHLMMHGGGVAVGMFFLVSGFVIFYVAHRETPRQFVIRRALRIFPPLWVSIIVLVIAYALMTATSGHPGEGQNPVDVLLRRPHPWLDFVAAMTLSNYLLGTPDINGVAWTLVVEVLFYLCVAALLPLLRSRPRLAMCLTFGAFATLQFFARAHWMVFLLAVNSAYVTFLFLGSLIYLRWSGRVDWYFFGGGTLAFWGLFVHGMSKLVVQPPYQLSDYGVSYAFAWFAFVVLLLLNDRLRLDRVSMFFSRISYSLYLNHGGLGYLSLSLLYPKLGYPTALLITFILVVAISAAFYRWVEAPSQRLARAWTKPALNPRWSTVAPRHSSQSE